MVKKKSNVLNCTIGVLGEEIISCSLDEKRLGNFNFVSIGKGIKKAFLTGDGAILRGNFKCKKVKTSLGKGLRCEKLKK